ncbi:HAD-IC family P-type ATPase, partial [Marinilabilia sp.]|uniref:HAD-IC family P-type ATPase n=1 Tax=Marinilabilia sp. TaxID=2021252 RepID=UPI0025C3C850
MKKLKLEIPLILPQVPDEKDQCVNKLISLLQEQKGLEEVHVSEASDMGVPQLCFHYNPELISIDRVLKIARQTGASITEKTGHKLIGAEGIRHPRHARFIERKLRSLQGIIEASVSASGMVRVELDTSQIDEATIVEALRKEGLDITDTALKAGKYLRGIKETEKAPKDKQPEKKPEHEEKEGEEHEHEHEHGGLFGKNTELIFSIACGILLATGFGLSFVDVVPSWVSLALYIGAYFFGGFYTAKEAIQTVAKGGFEIDFLMLVAAIGAAILGEWAEGALLLFLFSMGHALEHYAMNKARKSIAALSDLAPKTALRNKNGKTEDVGIESLEIGDVIVVRPNSKISADGVVVSGESSVNQAPITGESVPVDKIPVDDQEKDYSNEKDISDKNRVFSGTINGNNTLEVKVIKEASDSTLSRLVKLVNEAQTQKSPTQRFTDKFEKYFVPAVLGLVVLLLGAFLVIDESFSDSFYRAMSVLVAASPCALAISTPSAVLSGVARAAKSGVLIKGGRPLED